MERRKCQAAPAGTQGPGDEVCRLGIHPRSTQGRDQIASVRCRPQRHFRNLLVECEQRLHLRCTPAFTPTTHEPYRMGVAKRQALDPAGAAQHGVDERGCRRPSQRARLIDSAVHGGVRRNAREQQHLIEGEVEHIGNLRSGGLPAAQTEYGRLQGQLPAQRPVNDLRDQPELAPGDSLAPNRGQ